MTDYNKQQKELHNQFVAKLGVTMRAYPDYKIGTSDEYTKQLSLLNGITLTIKQLQAKIDTDITNLDRSIAINNADIDKLKLMEYNLNTVVNLHDLDATSKQMLDDSIREYSRSKLIFWIKCIVVCLLFIFMLVAKSYEDAGYTLVLSAIFMFIYIIYKYFRG